MMNTARTLSAFQAISPATPNASDLPQAPLSSIGTPAASPHHHYRERTFGVGYGNSSGYASPRRYGPVGQAPYFRCS